MKANRPLFHGAQPLSEHRLAFGAGPEFSLLERPYTSFEGRLLKSPAADPLPQASDQDRIFVLSKSTLPLDELYVTAILHNLITHAEGQSALNSCLRQGN